jgi:hypothetical protein
MPPTLTTPTVFELTEPEGGVKDGYYIIERFRNNLISAEKNKKK